jgi:hypothetical protein
MRGGDPGAGRYSMDLYKIIRELQQEVEKIDLVVESLEELIRDGTLTVGRHHGRKFMVTEERRIVSERMKKYWASRGKKPRS